MKQSRRRDRYLPVYLVRNEEPQRISGSQGVFQCRWFRGCEGCSTRSPVQWNRRAFLGVTAREGGYLHLPSHRAAFAASLIASIFAILSLALSPQSQIDAQRLSAVSQGATPFVLDGNRIYAELNFLRPDGSAHRALAFVDMGSPEMTLTSSLFDEVHAAQNSPLRFQIGGVTVEVPSAQVQRESGTPFSVGTDLKVEATLPASVLERYVVTIDYQNHSLEFAQPGAATLHGIPVPFRINRKTGLIAVEAVIDGKPYSVTIDNGSAYTWLEPDSPRQWLAAHPQWQRGTGAVGAANMMMSGDATETSGTLLRIPEISLGELRVRDVGALAVGPSRNFPGNLALFEWYSQKNAGPVIGWIGGNVLKSFRLTIDYPNETMYWQKQSEPDSHDLDQVGLTLRSAKREFYVAAIASKDGAPTVQGVLPGDKLLRVDNLDLSNANWGAVFAALHGKPGDTRTLILERKGKNITVVAKVTAF